MGQSPRQVTTILTQGDLAKIKRVILNKPYEIWKPLMTLKNQFYMLVALYSQNQWAEMRRLRIIKARDKFGMLCNGLMNRDFQLVALN